MRMTGLCVPFCCLLATTGCDTPQQQGIPPANKTAVPADQPTASKSTTTNAALNAVMRGIADREIRNDLVRAWEAWEKAPADSSAANTVIRIVEQSGEKHFVDGHRDKAAGAFLLAGKLTSTAISAGIDVDDPIEAYVYYNGACMKSLAQKLPEALELLDKAVATGFSDYGSITEDPDLAPLRNLPEFQSRLPKWKTQMGDEADR